MERSNIVKILFSILSFVITSLLTYLRSGVDNMVWLIITIVIVVIYIMIVFDLKDVFFKTIEDKEFECLSYMPCEYDEKKECCVNVYIRELKNSGKIRHIMLSKELLDKYKLISELEMNEKEKNFGLHNSEKKQVWVFSYDLSTEILGDDSQAIVKQNTQNGIKYHEFVLYNEETYHNIEVNKGILLSSLSKKSKNNMTIECIKEYNNSMNILPYLLGSIVFIEDNTPQSYFSLRGDGLGKTNPIYFKMPNCMNEKYYRYFKSKIENN